MASVHEKARSAAPLPPRATEQKVKTVYVLWTDAEPRSDAAAGREIENRDFCRYIIPKGVTLGGPWSPTLPLTDTIRLPQAPASTASPSPSSLSSISSSSSVLPRSPFSVVHDDSRSCGCMQPLARVPEQRATYVTLHGWSRAPGSRARGSAHAPAFGRSTQYPIQLSW